MDGFCAFGRFSCINECVCNTRSTHVVVCVVVVVQVKLLRDGAPTCFEEDDLVVLTEVHEAGDPLGELHHVLDGIGDVVGTLLPHPLCRLNRKYNSLQIIK